MSTHTNIKSSSMQINKNSKGCVSCGCVCFLIWNWNYCQLLVSQSISLDTSGGKSVKVGDGWSVGPWSVGIGMLNGDCEEYKSRSVKCLKRAAQPFN